MKILLKDVRMVFYDLIQVGPMFRTFISQLESEGQIELALEAADIDKIELKYCQVFKVLKSPEYLRDVPRVSSRLLNKFVLAFKH